MTEMAGGVLVVGTDPGRRDALVAPLAAAGFQVEVAQDGPAALERIEGRDFDVLLVDDDEGPSRSAEFVRRMIDAPSRPGVILIASAEEVRDGLAALPGRRVDYLIRPYELDDLLARVAVAARGRRERAAAPPAADLDPLTGLGNDAYFAESLERELAIASRYRRRLGLVLLDADDLTTINESFGRDSGDEFIRSIGRAILATVRRADRVARRSGDDFAILLPETHRSSLESFVDRLLVWVGSERFRAGDKLVPPELSLGTSVYPDEALDAPSLVRAAERELARVKRMKKTKTRPYRAISEEA